MPRLLAILLLGLALNVAQADTALFSAQGYRIGQYRSPTPATVDGAQTLDTQALQQLLGQASPPVLIDVYRRPWVQGRFIDNEPHNLPAACGWPILVTATSTRPGRTLQPSPARGHRRAVGFAIGLLLPRRLLAELERGKTRRCHGL